MHFGLRLERSAPPSQDVFRHVSRDRKAALSACVSTNHRVPAIGRCGVSRGPAGYLLSSDGRTPPRVSSTADDCKTSGAFRECGAISNCAFRRTRRRLIVMFPEFFDLPQARTGLEQLEDAEKTKLPAPADAAIVAPGKPAALATGTPHASAPRIATSPTPLRSATRTRGGKVVA